MAGTWNFGNLRFLKNVRVPFFKKNPQKKCVLKNPVLPGSKIPLLATHKIISHIWEDRSRKVNNDEPDLRFFHGNFWLVIFWTVCKPCFSPSIPRGPNIVDPWVSSRRFFTFLRIFGHSMALFGVRRGFKMILSHGAPSSLNMSSYRAIWTHFRPNSMIFIHLILQTWKGCWHLGWVPDRFTTDSRQIRNRFTRDAS